MNDNTKAMKDQIINRLRSELNSEVSDKAIANFEQELALTEITGISDSFLKMLSETNSIHNLLHSAFVWSETPQGESYWNWISKGIVN
ncbi:hypothetical protein [Sphingobacterium sp. UBA2074]|uniref:hypothetical protein n=1 Tax=Sphingobacterium sp. UBA2074 TaxID=1947487 RepID=UPI00257D7237|nr:hypothetical protein [Sphingobacterium sp. UBA2074]